MISIVPGDAGSFRIIDARGRESGRIQRRTLRFTGFLDEDHVIEAARVAWLALEGVLRGRPTSPGHWLPRMDRLRLVHDGAYEWISDGRIPVARLIRPRPVRGTDPAGAARTYAMELVVPSWAPDGTPTRAALAIADALSRAHHLAPTVLAGASGWSDSDDDPPPLPAA